jgi:hypothetical protein
MYTHMQLKQLRLSCMLSRRRAGALFGYSLELIFKWERGECGLRADAQERLNIYERRLTEYARSRSVSLPTGGQ